MATEYNLTHSAFLNKRFDVVVTVENVDYGHKVSFKNVPSHKDISTDLEAKKNENPEMYRQFYELLKKVFECHVVSKKEYSLIHFDVRFTQVNIFKIIIWLIIEQDIAYWSYSDRNMTWGIVPNKH